MMRDAFVAIDAGLALILGQHVLLVDRLLLPVAAHRVEAVAIAAFARIDGFHPLPFVRRHFHAMRLELLRRVDIAGELAPDFLAGLDLANDLGNPRVWHMAIRTDRAHAGTIAVMNR